MAEPFIGEIRLFAFSFPPANWAQCNGQLMAVAQNKTLAKILGSAYGGNGTQTFGLPNLVNGSVPVGAGQGPGLSSRALGSTGGAVSVVLQPANMPSHTHTLHCSQREGADTTPGNQEGLGKSSTQTPYADAPTDTKQIVALSTTALSAGPGSGPNQVLAHNNMMPYLSVNFCIALTGVTPKQ